MRDLLKRNYLLIILLVILFCFSKDVSAFSPNFDYEIRSHHLIIQIDPDQHFIKAEDRLEILPNQRKPQTLSFYLHGKLEIKRIINSKTGESFDWSETSLSDGVKRFDIRLKKPEKSCSLSVSYEGRIYDPVVKEKALHFVRGDQTMGLIGPEGVYLSSSSYWYPDRLNSMAIFHVEASVPEPFRITTQGELLSETLEKGHWKSRWANEWPSESLTLVAGEYSVKTRMLDDIRISTYFYKEDESFSEIFLNAAEEYLKMYGGLLGSYPYKKFDIVQNFFSSGYGFPSFTLLAPEAIRQGKEFLRPGALDHEIVHSWWGHYVSGKPGTGNWVEALTTYCTNYYYKELQMGEEVARKHRQDVMQKYAIQVSPSKAYSLRKFEEKRDDLDGQIGYGKGSMVFHMLRQIVGKDQFFVILRRFAKQYGGKQASWGDLQKVFEEGSGKRLGRFFSQWLDRPEGPQLKLAKVGVRSSPTGYSVSGEVVQEGEIYEVQVQVKVESSERKRDFLLDISGRKTAFSFEVPKLPLTLSLDPEGHIFRRLYPEEIIPGLNVLLEDREKLFVLPDRGEEESRKIYLELAAMAKERKGGEILKSKELTEEKIRHSSVMLLGESWREPIFSKLLSNLPAPIRLVNGTFFVNGKEVVEHEESLLLTWPHPLTPGKWVTIYFGNSAAALSRGRFIFFYGWDSYLLFKKGRPAERGDLPPSRSMVFVDLLSRDLHGIQSQRLGEHVSYLASPELAGRFPGTSGYRKAKDYLIKKLEEMGIQPILQPFSIRVKDISDAQLTLSTSSKKEVLHAIPFYFSREEQWMGPAIFDDANSLKPLEENMQGKAVLTLLCSLCEGGDPEQVLFGKILDYQNRGASALVIFLEEEEWDSFLPYLTYPSCFLPSLGERHRKKEKAGYSIHPFIEASKVVARAKKPPLPIEIPVLFAPYAREKEEELRHTLNRGDVSIELSLQFEDKTIDDANIGGILSGDDPEKGTEFLVLGAHYDHLGKDEKSGSYFTGADDNASGVSSLLEIGQLLSEKRRELRRSLVLLFFGGEEWGLVGSRYFVENPFVPLSQIKAMFSVDTIGGSTNEKEVFLVGSSVHPSLAGKSRRFLQQVGIKEGREIDRFAFTFGSDHYPFHERGIPAIDFFASDYKKLHSLRDNVEAIDFKKLEDVTRLIYLTVYEFLTEP